MVDSVPMRGGVGEFMAPILGFANDSPGMGALE
jgi:hypothetical protein